MKDSAPKTEIEQLKDAVAQGKKRCGRLLGLSFALAVAGTAGVVYYEQALDTMQDANHTLKKDLSKANQTSLDALDKAIEAMTENIHLHRDLAKRDEASHVGQLVVHADAMAKASMALCEKEGAKRRVLEDVYHDTARFVEGLGGYTHRQIVPVAETLSLVQTLQEHNIRVVERNLRSTVNPVMAQWFNSSSYGQVLVVDDLLFSDGQRAVRALVNDVLTGRTTVPSGHVLALVAEDQEDYKAYPDGYKLHRVSASIGADKAIVTSDDLPPYRIKIAAHPCPQ
ncbi:hypothetical protein [Micavibrio aeruginosavorus]|uniref:Uncharacterized protein n=1 Tax=Micavibrio aeruginosavorus (strain ARL-13) TaxID=856793 RepID=G2KLD1_MICAA|nr:hypothetical protein [Micavibrio aeruginosavorus]AEP08367.1 hypothetical protein MICA_19 [Micavibrio aeruginosavorus ARL-13]